MPGILRLTTYVCMGRLETRMKRVGALRRFIESCKISTTFQLLTTTLLLRLIFHPYCLRTVLSVPQLRLPKIHVPKFFRHEPCTPRILHSSRQLPLITHVPQPLSLLWRQSEIELNSNSMYNQRDPYSHWEAYIQRRITLLRITIIIDFHDNLAVNCQV